MPRRSFRLFLTFFVPTVLAGAALILLAPALVDPDRAVAVWLPVALVLVLGGCAAAAWAVRPDRGPRGGGNDGDLPGPGSTPHR